MSVLGKRTSVEKKLKLATKSVMIPETSQQREDHLDFCLDELALPVTIITSTMFLTTK